MIQGLNQGEECVPASVPPPANPAFRVRGKLLVRSTGRQSAWGDMFASDYSSHAMHVDVAKIQMFVFTVILAFAYAASVANHLIAANGQVTALPDLDSGFVTLLGLSQGGYLATKVVKGATSAA